MQSARMAVRSLDVQTYIWHADLTGKFLASQLLESADRGVRVRLLVDDMDARAKNARFAALAAHPNIEVRVFNPFASRNGTLSLVSEGARNFKRINRRMHNKTWIADNRLAIVGGRNLGDEYFGASDEVNFVDLDFGMLGPVVRDASASFDRYWNSPSAYPLELLDADGVDPESAEKGCATAWPRLHASPKPAAMRRRCARTPRFSASIAGDWPMEWSGNYRFIADDPLKITMKKRDAQPRGRERRAAAGDARCEVGARCHFAVLRSGRQRQHGTREHRARAAARSESSRTRSPPTMSRRCTAATRATARSCSRAACSSGS